MKSTKAQVIIVFAMFPFTLLGALAALCWNAVNVGYWFVDQFFDP